ncbi:hypothetical protein EMCG_04761 [[Emmonsia] crescens]|uniref:SMP-30/Gluconolactonase/LRE-like region domain-containing protein n=1 Tax=[Emmonsia] crescens TaxID=73230 RepID=A0A0G2IYH5_9EURO|nr:hypothetical protein EMCG_04761 [Emmonsia crescens UAMH 3008]
MSPLAFLTSLLLLLFTSITALQTSSLKIHHPEIPFIPSPILPPPNPSTNADQIATLFNHLDADTKWTLIDKIHLDGNLGEPEGLIRLSSPNSTDVRYAVSLGHFPLRPLPYPFGKRINGTDRTAGAGTAHLVLFDGTGTRIADAQLSGNLGDDDEYHPGGIDYDGQHIWMTIAQYRPNSTARIVRVDPRSLQATTLFHADDHYGAVVRDTRANRLLALNWGSRDAAVWDLNDYDCGGATLPDVDSDNVIAKPTEEIRNPSFFIDYQDCKFLGYPAMYGGERAVMICAGVSGRVGGLALVDMKSMVPLAEVPLSMKSSWGGVITQNPFDVGVVEGRLRGYFMPDLLIGAVYVYEAQIS